MRVSAILTIGILALAEDARADGAHVTCVGDSITYGYGLTNPAAESYPARLQGLLGPGYAVQNDGHSGATMLVSGDLPYTTVPEYASATAWAAAGGDVVIQLGTNDSKPHNWAKKASFQADCESLVAYFQASPGKPRVWVSLPPPAFPPSCCTIDSANLEKGVIPLLKQCAAAKGASTIDVFGALASQGAHFADHVHPDAAASLLIAQAVQAALTKQPTVSLAVTSASPVTLRANATAAYGKIEQIEVFEDAKSVAKSTTPDIRVSGLALGPHSLFAVATETGGRTARSQPVSVAVTTESPSPPPAPAPTAKGSGCATRSSSSSSSTPALVLGAAVAIVLRRRRRGR